MTSRPYETEIVESSDGAWVLRYRDRPDGELRDMETPQGRSIIHHAELLLQEIQAELKAGTPDQMIQRFSNYQLLCSQIDEFTPIDNSRIDYSLPKKNITGLLMQDMAFASMHPPEEIERQYNLRFLSEFLSNNFGEAWLGNYLDRSYVRVRKGPKFIELRDAMWLMYKQASLEQHVVMHSVYHMSDSLTVAILFAYKYATPKELGLAALACHQLIPDTMDEEEKMGMLDHLDLISGHAGIMMSYLGNSVPLTVHIISQGEGIATEFKATFRRNIHTGKPDKNIESSALKEIVAFLNTLGGNLIIGVDDDGNISGLRQDIFSSKDVYKTHIANQFNARVGAEYGKYLKYHWDILDGETVLRIECKELPNTEEAFLDGELYVRNSAQTIKLSTKEAINWRNNRTSDSSR